ncbi:MAG: hypothetical protein OXF23_05030, partial [Candidatus Dadabacteria bacterium]|nr:hypothetical protein [Candidatus Dadabacteria bacterium]
MTITEKNPTFTYNDEKRHGRKAWTLYIKTDTPEKLFYLKRKKDIARELKPQSMAKVITDIERAGVRIDGRCIQVDHPSGLYLTDDYTVTHNSYALLLEPLYDIEVPGFQAVAFRRTVPEIRNPGGLWDES